MLAASARADVSCRRGALADAEQDATTALELAQSHGRDYSVYVSAAALLMALTEQGRLAEAEVAAAEARDSRGAKCDLAIYVCCRGWLRIAQGRPVEALAEFQMAGSLAREAGHDLPGFWAWRVGAATAQLALGRRADARSMACEQLQLVQPFGAPGPIGVALRTLGLIEHGQAQLDLLHAATLELERSPALLERARAHLELGAALRRAGRRTESRQPLRAALDLADRCGAVTGRAARPRGTPGRGGTPAALPHRQCGRADGERAARGAARGQRPHQPRDRAGAFRDREGGREAPRQRVPEARHPGAGRARQRSQPDRGTLTAAPVGQTASRRHAPRWPKSGVPAPMPSARAVGIIGLGLNVARPDCQPGRGSGPTVSTTRLAERMREQAVTGRSRSGHVSYKKGIRRMRARLYRQRIVTALAAALMPAAMLTGLEPAEAQAGTCESWSGAQPASPGTRITRCSVRLCSSPCDAWAVGFQFSGGTDQTLIEHWNGAAWKVVPSPDPGSADNSLTSIRAVSAANIWAVGSFSDGVVSEALILHWDGHSWAQFENPDPGSTANDLDGVRAVSASDVWAVGSYSSGTADRTLILHWNGAGWKQVASPHPGSDSVLLGVAATSRRNAWAVGNFSSSGRERNLILHWNGAHWKQVPSPDPGVIDSLDGIGATSAANAWAVGFSANGSGGPDAHPALERQEMAARGQP